MFKKLKISAPGKIILCGEHAVVYGKKAVASAINLRTYLKITLENSSFEIRYLDKCINLNENEFNSLNEYNFNEDLNHLIAYLNQTTNGDKVYDAVRFVLLTFQKTLNWQILNKLKIEINTEIPIGSGLGSSASLAVCLSSAFLILSNKISLKELSFTMTDLDQINKYAYYIEKLFHGNPSGIDNTVSTYGNFLIYKKGTDIETFKSNHNLKILIVNSCVPKKTLEQVAKVRTLYEKYTPLVELLLESIDCLVNQFIEIIRDNKNIADLNDLISMNQGLLSSLQVSNFELNKIVNLAQLNGFTAKITGAGGGGCCFILLNDDNINDLKLKLIDDLKLSDFIPFEIILGDKGVHIEEIEF